MFFFGFFKFLLNNRHCVDRNNRFVSGVDFVSVLSDAVSESRHRVVRNAWDFLVDKVSVSIFLSHIFFDFFGGIGA